LALVAFEKAICLDPTNPQAYEGKGKTLHELGSFNRLQEALSAYAQAIHLDSQNEVAYIGRGKTCMLLLRYQRSFNRF